MVMMNIPAVDQTLLLLLIVFGLGTCLVRVVWELEQVRLRRVAAPPRRSATRGD